MLPLVAGKDAAISTLIALGIDAENPTEVQKDFIHLCWWREVMQAVAKTEIIVGAVSFFGDAWRFRRTRRRICSRETMRVLV